jgi:AcrR family transcriptional regulator
MGSTKAAKRTKAVGRAKAADRAKAAHRAKPVARAKAADAPVAPTTPRRSGSANVGLRAQKAAARREAIIAAALEEFSAQGFAAARLEDVARRAGVAKGTIYLHFRDKETLFQEIIRSVLSPVVATLEGVLASDIAIRAVADRLVDVFVREIYSTRRKDVIRLIISEGPRFPKIAEFYYREVLSRIFGALRVLLARAAQRGELAGDAAVRFPQLVGAPVVLAIVWNSLFERFEPLDVRAFLHAHLDVLFGSGRAA